MIRSQGLRSVTQPRQQRVLQGILLGLVLGIAVLLLWWLGAFSNLRMTLNDVYFIPQETTDRIAIVALDNDSLERFGRSPLEWDRRVYADVIEAVSAAEARVIALDILFSEMTEADAELAQAITDVRQSDARTRIVLANAGVQVNPTQTLFDFMLEFPNGLVFDTELNLASELEGVADYRGFVNSFPDSDGTVRRQPSLIYVQDGMQVSFSWAAYLAYLRVPASQFDVVLSAEPNRLQVAGNPEVAVDKLGMWQQNFFGTPATSQQSTFPVISLQAVVDGDFDPSIFRDRIVLVGLVNSTGALDQYQVPLSASGELMAGVEIQANAIETLLQHKVVIPQSAISQVVMILGLSLLAGVVYHNTRWFVAIGLGLAMLIVWVIFTFIYFSLTNVTINLFHSSVALGLPVLAAIGLEITREVRRRQTSEFILSSVVDVSEQNLQLDKILPQVAGDIQSVVPAKSGSIWLYDSASQQMQRSYRWGVGSADEDTAIAKLIYQVKLSRNHVQTPPYLAIPIMWGKNLVGAYTLRTDKPIANRHLPLLFDLGEQLAPSLENAQLHEKVEDQHDVLSAIFKGSPTGIVVIDQHLQVLEANDLFYQFLPEEMQNGDHVDETLPEILSHLGVSDEARQQLEQTLRSSEAFSQEMSVHGRTYRVNGAPLRQAPHWVVTFSDVTNLVELNKMKTQMIRMASHDLQNPLSRIMGYSSLMKLDSDQFSEDILTYLQYIESAGDEMHQLIRDLLSLEQFRASQMVEEPLDLHNMVIDIHAQLLPDASKKSQIFTTELGAEPVTVMGDKRQITQAIINLVGNAIKYTPEGGAVTIRVTQDDGQVRVAVEDTGYGIAAEHQEKLFSEFYRVRTRTTAGIPGTGLGLSLVKSVVEAHRGSVGMESEEGVGSTFYFDLPVAELVPA